MMAKAEIEIDTTKAVEKIQQLTAQAEKAMEAINSAKLAAEEFANAMISLDDAIDRINVCVKAVNNDY